MGILTDNQAGILSKAFEVWRRLYSRYNLDPGAPVDHRTEVATFIIPVTSADDLLKGHGVKRFVSAYGIGASGEFTIFTVPDNRRWQLHHFEGTRSVGDNLFRRMSIYDYSEGRTATLDDPGAGVSTRYLNFSAVFILEPKDEIRAELTGAGVASTTFDWRIWITEEPFF